MNKAIFAASAALILVTGLQANPYYPNTGSSTPSTEKYYNTAPNSQPASYNVFQKNKTSLQAKPAANATIVTVAGDEASISTLLSAIREADLSEVLGRPGPYTLFAPNNDAFKKLSPETWTNLMKPENKEKLKEILKNHVIPGKFEAAEIKSETLYSLDGKPLELKVNGKEITINGAKVIKADILGSNGVIHIVDTVLVPKN